MRWFRNVAIIGLGIAVTGCSLIVGTAVVGTAVVVGTVGAVGYTVYKGGEAVVSGVGSVGSAAKSLVVSDGTLETEANYAVEPLYAAAESAMREMKLIDVQGTKDGMAGALRARTAVNEAVDVRFALVKENRTTVKIRVGDGNLQQAEVLYDRMIAKLGTTGGRG